ncbi:hypothetical protein HDE_14548 [Halotydeus destructor]|nr:hypothetical protein HDE_14548 [Halotydeus destructor]
MLSAYTLIFSALIGHSYGQLVGVSKCGKKEAEMFAIQGARPLVANVHFNWTFPVDSWTATAYCQESKAAVAYMKSFAGRCLDTFPRQVTKLIVYATGPTIEENAANKLKCNNKAIATIAKVEDDYIDRYRRVPFMDTKKKIPAICCGYYQLQTELRAASRKMCSDSDADYLVEYVNNLAGDVLDLLCSATKPGSEECRTLVYPNQRLKDEPSVSYIAPLIKILESL